MVLLDLRKFESGKVFDCPLCIFGAGAAGLTVARRLLAAGWPVLLVESGGRDFEGSIHALADGRSLGHPYYPLDEITLRMLGGTTAIWGGRCAELDPLDFATRCWVPHSGWPVSYRELEPYYREARKVFSVADAAGAYPAFRARLPALADLDAGEFAARLWSFDGAADRFACAHIADVLDHPRARVLIHATATRLHLSGDGRRVCAVDVKDVSGKRATVHARHVVLALGGIETPRLLLASDAEAPAGIGNGRGLVGRYFMEHPHARGGSVSGPGMWQLLDAFGRRHRVGGREYAALLHLSADSQRRYGVLNSALTLGLRQPATARQFWTARSYATLKHSLNATRVNRYAWRAAKNAVRSLNAASYPWRHQLSVKCGRTELAVILRAEQAPNPDSRVCLNADRDALGCPRVDLHWAFSEIDKRSAVCLVERLDAALRIRGLGAVKKSGWLEDPDVLWRTDTKISAHPVGGYHLMGTARMAGSPSEGVVDAQCRVHGLENLHIAGSAVFPTGGWANPTETIVALALRLADQLGRP